MDGYQQSCDAHHSQTAETIGKYSNARMDLFWEAKCLFMATSRR